MAFNVPKIDNYRKYHSAVAFVGDVHIGPRGESLGALSKLVSQSVTASFLSLFDWLAQKRIRTLVVAGDLFDRTTITPSTVGAIKTRIHDFCNSKGGQVIYLSGNHDRSATEAAGDYLRMFGVDYVTKPSAFRLSGVSTSLPIPRVLCIPWMPGTTARDAIGEGLLEAGSLDDDRKPVALVGHFGVHPDKAPPWVKNDPWYVPATWLIDQCREAGIRYSILAHEHQHMVAVADDGCKAANIGAFAPRSYAEQGSHFGNVAVLHNIRENIDSKRRGPAADLSFELDAVAGIRFYPHGKYACKETSAGSRNWFLVGDGEPGIDCGSETPREVSQTYGAITLISRGAQFKADEDAMPHVTVGDIGAAIEAYLEDNDDAFDDPVQVRRDAAAKGIEARASAVSPGRGMVCSKKYT